MNYILTVSEVNRYIREIISRDIVLSNLWVKGEISNFKNHSSGHLYFTLKDDRGLIRCVMFRSQAAGLRFIPDNGLKVMIRGNVSVFERDGQYQLYAEEMQPDGLGSLHLAFEQLKKKLQEEGLFDAGRKKPLPYMPQTIGVITSSTGAAIRDILNILDRRFKNLHIKIFPVPVQGESAPRCIAHAIRKMNEQGGVEVIILARGGGSLEELWAFNEEAVARSIAESHIPIISAVGHETDFTIVDFAADLRAPTPSAAAELVIPEKYQLTDKLSGMEARLLSGLRKNLDGKRNRFERIIRSPAFRQPYEKVYQERMQLDSLQRFLQKSMLVCAERSRARLSILAGRLNSLSPLEILSRGYSVTRDQATGRIIKSVEGVRPGTALEIRVSDGTIRCKAESTENFNPGEL